MLGGLQCVGLLEVGVFEEEAAHLRHEEHDGAEHEQEDTDRLQVVHRVVGMEGNAIHGNPVGSLVLLDLDAVGVVGAHLVQCQQVQYHQAEQHYRQRHHVQREEPVQGDPGNQVVAANPRDDALADHGYGAEQGDDDLRPPVRHLTPGQHVTHERFGHEDHEDQHAENPDELARLLVGTVDERAEHVQVHHDEEGRCAGGMHVTQHPAVIHITHDVLDGCKGVVRGGHIVHREPDTGEQLVHQHQQREHAEVIPDVEVLRRVVLPHVGVPGAHDGQTLVHPVPKSDQHICH